MNNIILKKIILENKIKFIIINLLVLLTTFLSLYPVILIKKIINIATSKGEVKIIIILGSAYILLHSLNALFKGITTFYIKHIELSIGNKIREDIFNSIIHMKKENSIEITSSELLTKVIEDAQITVKGFLTPFISIFSAISSFIYGFYLMLNISWQLTLIIFPIGFFSTYFAKKNGMKLESIVNLSRKNSENLWDTFSESIYGLSEIQANNKENFYKNKLKKYNIFYSKTALKGSKIRIKVNIFNSILFMLVIGIIMISGAILVTNNSISIGSLVALMMYNSLLIDPIFDGINFYMDLKNVKISIKRLNEILSLKQEEDHITYKIKHFKGHLKTQNIAFNINQNKILDNINLDIKKGESIAIVGESGAGKSTLFNLMLGFYTPTRGKIIYSEKILMEPKTKNSIRDNISVVFQENFIFNGTIRDNLLFNNPKLNNEDMLELLKIVEFSSLKTNKKDILSLNINDKKGGFSGGEKKKLQIARALAKQSEIFFFDELTTSLDNISIEKILRNIKKVFPKSTMIFIDHRLEYTKNVDKIFFLKNGTILEQGSHGELLNKRGEYYKLWECCKFCVNSKN